MWNQGKWVIAVVTGLILVCLCQWMDVQLKEKYDEKYKTSHCLEKSVVFLSRYYVTEKHILKLNLISFFSFLVFFSFNCIHLFPGSTYMPFSARSLAAMVTQNKKTLSYSYFCLFRDTGAYFLYLLFNMIFIKAVNPQTNITEWLTGTGNILFYLKHLQHILDARLWGKTTTFTFMHTLGKILFHTLHNVLLLL